jgi:hypothetical protein
LRLCFVIIAVAVVVGVIENGVVKACPALVLPLSSDCCFDQSLSASVVAVGWTRTPPPETLFHRHPSEGIILVTWL